MYYPMNVVPDDRRIVQQASIEEHEKVIILEPTETRATVYSVGEGGGVLMTVHIQCDLS